MKMSSKVRLSLHMSQVAHQARAYPGFCSMKRLGVFYIPLDGMLVHCSVTPAVRQSPFIHLGGEALCKYSVLPKNTMQCPLAELKT